VTPTAFLLYGMRPNITYFTVSKYLFIIKTNLFCLWFLRYVHFFITLVLFFFEEEYELYLVNQISPVTVLEWPRGFQEVKVPRFHDNGTGPYAPAAFTPRKFSWYSFLLEAESTPGPW